MQLYSPPRSSPLTVAEAKSQLRIQHSADDVEIGEMIKTAAAFIETAAHRTLVACTWLLELNRFPAATILLPRPPAISLDSFRYRDADGNWNTVTASDYIVDTKRQPGAIYRKRSASWPSPDLDANCVSIRFTAGIAAPCSIDAATDTLTINGRTFADGDRVELQTSGTLPSELTTGRTYFVRDASGDATTFTCKLAATSGGSAIALGANSGQHWVGTDLREWATVRHAMKLLVGHWYANRGDEAIAPSNVAQTMGGIGIPPQAMNIIRQLEVGDEFDPYPENQ